MHVHIEIPCRQLNRVEAVDKIIILCSSQFWLSILLCLAAMGWVAKMALLLAIVSAEAVCS